MNPVMKHPQSPSTRNIRKILPNLLAGLLLTGLCLGFTGCDMPAMPWDKKPDPKAAEAEKKAKEEAAAAEQGGGEEPAGPVDELDLLPPEMKKLPYEEVNITLKDQLILYGRLYDPSMKPDGESDASTSADSEEYTGPKYPLVILLHGLNRDHVAWSALPATLVKAGYAVFSMDLRGHGKSSVTTWKRRVSWRLFKPEQWLQLPKDVDEVIQFFQKGEDYPQVDGKTVALIGEKLGSNIAVYAARDNHAAVKALVLISPGLDYKGIIPSQAIVDYTNPALLITSQDDAYSYDSTERLYNWLLGPKSLQVYKKIGDGSDMLSNRASLASQIADWLGQNMPSTAAPKTEAVKAEEAKPSKEGKSKAAKKPEEKPSAATKPQAEG